MTETETESESGTGTEIGETVVRLGLAQSAATVVATPLTGGVSSDIWRIDLPDGPICVKRALARLKVAAVWEAPIERNRYEYEWLRIAEQALPGSVPHVLSRIDDSFAMEFLDYPVWKAQLREGNAVPAFAKAVGRALRTIHDATAERPDIAERFPTDDIFQAIRIEPYLLATAVCHPDLAARIIALAERTTSIKDCLVHGDVSPKNILAGPGGPVFLDAECAWYGDPAFDLAFCLNHLLLKCLWVPPAAPGFLQCFDGMINGYEPGAEIERRTASLLPALLLARVDGKSPVEYLNATNKESVRQTARPLIAHPPLTLEEVRKAWQKSLM